MRYRFLLLILIFVSFHENLAGQNGLEDELVRSIRSEKNERKKFSRQLALGQYYIQHNIRKADSVGELLLNSSRNFDDSIRFTALLFSTQMSKIKGDQQTYFTQILGLQAFLRSIENRSVQLEIYKYLGIYHSLQGEYLISGNYFKKARTLAKAERNNILLSGVYSEAALDMMRQNKKDSALNLVEEAIQFGRRSSNRSVLARTFGVQAGIYRYFGQTELSVAKNLVGLRLAIENNNLPLMTQFSREVGQSQRLINNMEDAEFYFIKSLEYALKLADDRQIALAYTNLGTVYTQRRKFEEAENFQLRAIAFLLEVNDYNGLGEANDNLGVIYRELVDYDKALAFFNKSLVFYESTGNKEKIAGVYHNVGTVFVKQGKYKNALNYLDRSVEIRNQIGSISQVYGTYKVIAQVYSALGQTKKAFTYMECYVNYQDSTASVQASTKIAELSELYKAEQREELISIQADSIERQAKDRELTNTRLENIELRSDFQIYVIIAFVLFLILGGVIAFYRFNQTKIKQKQTEAEMSQTLLRAQMNPHFVFNAMSVIQSYIFENDSKKSSKFLVNFSRLMRLILENSPKEFIPLETEREILQKYLETQKLRFEDRFVYNIVVETELLDENVVIPPMITQPFIENAIEHGQLHLRKNGYINIHFYRKEEMLEIEIEDNGVGRETSGLNKKSQEHKSMAMDITRKRISNLNYKYRTNGQLLIEDLDKDLKTGTKVLISLPYRTE